MATTLLGVYTSLTPMADGTWIAYVPRGSKVAGGRQCMVYPSGVHKRPDVSDNGFTCTSMIDHVDVVVPTRDGKRMLRIQREADDRAVNAGRVRLRIGTAR